MTTATTTVSLDDVERWLRAVRGAAVKVAVGTDGHCHAAWVGRVATMATNDTGDPERRLDVLIRPGRLSIYPAMFNGATMDERTLSVRQGPILLRVERD